MQSSDLGFTSRAIKEILSYIESLNLKRAFIGGFDKKAVQTSMGQMIDIYQKEVDRLNKEIENLNDSIQREKELRVGLEEQYNKQMMLLAQKTSQVEQRAKQVEDEAKLKLDLAHKQAEIIVKEAKAELKMLKEQIEDTKKANSKQEFQKKSMLQGIMGKTLLGGSMPMQTNLNPHQEFLNSGGNFF